MRNTAAALLIAFLSAPPLLRADVVIQRSVFVDAFEAPPGTFISTATVYLASPALCRSEHFILSWIPYATRGTQVEIIRPGEDLIHITNDDPKRVWRGRISEIALESGQLKYPTRPGLGVAKAEIKVAPSDEKREMFGFPCRRVVGTLSMDLRDRTKGEKTIVRLTVDTWTTPTTPALAEAERLDKEYDQAFSRAAQVDHTLDEAAQWGWMVPRKLGIPHDRMKSLLDNLRSALAESKEYAVVVDIAWYVRREDKAGRVAPVFVEKTPDLSRPSDLPPDLVKRITALAMENKHNPAAWEQGREPVYRSRIENHSVEARPLDPALFTPPSRSAGRESP